MPRFSFRTAFLAATFVLLASDRTPAGPAPIYSLTGAITGKVDGDPFASSYFAELRFLAGQSAELTLISFPTAAGTWKSTGQFTESANFTKGIETAIETFSGKPAKVNFYKFPRLVRVDNVFAGMVKAKFKTTSLNDIVVKQKWSGFICGQELP